MSDRTIRGDPNVAIAGLTCESQQGRLSTALLLRTRTLNNCQPGKTIRSWQNLILELPWVIVLIELSVSGLLIGFVLFSTLCHKFSPLFPFSLSAVGGFLIVSVAFTFSLFVGS